MVPNEVYTGMTYGDKKFATAELTDALKGYVGVINKNQMKKLSPAWVEGFKGILDGEYDELAEGDFYMLGGIEQAVAKYEKRKQG